MRSEHCDLSAGDGAEEWLLECEFTGEDLPGLRVAVGECAAWAGLTEPRWGEFVLAVNEIASNAVEHGGGRGCLTLRRRCGELECSIADEGPGFPESVVPELLPGLDGAHTGRGLWLARLVTDRLVIRGGAMGAAGSPAVNGASAAGTEGAPDVGGAAGAAGATDAVNAVGAVGAVVTLAIRM
ncbi:ATP-binding protein [Streptomyces sp. NPDC050610]|uniref:ATP-binding protein n=1 Tax=Streptomyces sp. NPDC050610 TaxID=3157097 RepID=UPI00341DC448